MKCSVVGYEYFDYQNKAGQTVPSCRLHVEYPKRDCEGVAVEPVFVRRETLADYRPQVGDDIVLDYNRYGSVVSVERA